MEKLLTKYLKNYNNWEYIHISYFNYSGSECRVIYYTDDSHHYKEDITINVWEILEFMMHDKI